MAQQEEEKVEDSQSLLTTEAEATPTIMELVKDQESEIPNSQVNSTPQAEPEPEIEVDWQKEIDILEAKELGKIEAIKLTRQHLQPDSDGSDSTVKASYAKALTSR